MTRKKKITAAVLLVLAGGLSFIGFAGWRYAYVTVPNAFEALSTASLVNDYMNSHEDAWPGGWDDLRKTNDSSHQPSPEHLADLAARVEVDWKANPQVLAAAPQPTHGSPPFRVIWLKDGRDGHLGDAEPNGLVWLFLQMRGVKKLGAQTQPAAS